MNFDKIIEQHKKSKQIKSQREDIILNVSLQESSHAAFPLFSFPELVKLKLGRDINPPDDDLEDSEEHRKLKEIAKKFKQKYGEKSSERSKFGEVEDYVDLGMGYDASDPFIDDSEAYDELVPSSLSPAKGGFYVNRGVLDFRNVDHCGRDGKTGLVCSKTSQKPSSSKLALENENHSKTKPKIIEKKPDCLKPKTNVILLEKEVSVPSPTALKNANSSAIKITTSSTAVNSDDEDDVPLAIAVRKKTTVPIIPPLKRPYRPPGLPPLSAQRKSPLKKLCRNSHNTAGCAAQKRSRPDHKTNQVPFLSRLHTTHSPNVLNSRLDDVINCVLGSFPEQTLPAPVTDVVRQQN